MPNIFLSTRPMFGTIVRTYLLIPVRIFWVWVRSGGRASQKSARLEVNYSRVALRHHTGRRNAMLSVRARYRGLYSIKYRRRLLG